MKYVNNVFQVFENMNETRKLLPGAIDGNRFATGYYS